MYREQYRTGMSFLSYIETDGAVAAVAVKCHIMADDLRREMVLNTLFAEIHDVPSRRYLVHRANVILYVITFLKPTTCLYYYNMPPPSTAELSRSTAIDNN